MSKSINTRYAIAGTVAVIGTILAWRAIDRNEPQSSSTSTQSTSAVVQSTLDGIRLESSADSAASMDFRSAVEDRVRSVASQSEEVRGLRLTSHQIDDLAAAFADRVIALLDPDFDAVSEELSLRGITLPVDDDARVQWQGYRQWLGDSPEIGLDQVSIVAVYDRGRLLETHPVRDGWETLTMTLTPSAMPLSSDPEQASLTILEIRIPMEQKAIRSGKRRALPTGFQFAWNTQRSQWVPWSTRLYQDPADDEPYAAVPFR